MRLSRGDVILRRGEFALAWDTQMARSMRIFPIADAAEGFVDHDVVVPAWQEFAYISRIANAVIRITAARIEPPHDWVKIPDLALDFAEMTSIRFAMVKMLADKGPLLHWPTFGGMDLTCSAPILAS